MMHYKYLLYKLIIISLQAILVIFLLSYSKPAFCGKLPYVLWSKPVKPNVKIFASPDGVCFVTIDEDGNIVCRDYKSSVLWTRKLPAINAIAISKQGAGFIAYSLHAQKKGYIYLLNARGKVVWRFKPRKPILCAAIEPGGLHAGFGTSDGYAYVCSFKRSRPRYRRWSVPGTPVSICFDPKSPQVVLGLQGTGAVGAYTLKGQPIWLAEGDSEKRYTATFCANGSYLLYHGIAKTQDSSHLGVLTPDGKLVWSIEVGGTESKSAISYPGDYVAYGFTMVVEHQSKYTRRRFTRLYSLSGKRLWEQGGMLFKPFLVTLTPSGNTLVHDGQKAFSLLDINGRRIGHLRMPATIRSCAPAPHSGRVLVLTGDGLLNLIHAGG